MIRLPSYCVTIAVFVLSYSCKKDQKISRELFTEEKQDWFISGEAEWMIEQQEITGFAHDNSGFVMTEDKFANFYLEMEFYPDSTINSGVFVRCRDMALSATDCYEINIWDEHPQRESRTGAVVGRTKPLTYVATLNRWNTYKIQCSENRIEAWINGSKVVDLEDNTLKEGYLGLQASGQGNIRFRNIKLTELDKRQKFSY